MQQLIPYKESKTDHFMKCYFTGCNKEAVNEVKKLFGDQATFYTCQKHTPSKDKRPDSLKDMAFHYEVKPIKK